MSIGPVTLRNRVIRSAAFENMAYGNSPSQDLYDYHVAVARGGVGMTTLAYASVNRSGLSFDGQLWMREAIVPGLKRITDAVHAAGAKCSIQLGHCGNMTHRATCGCMPVGASSGFNLYSPSFVRGLRVAEIDALVEDFGHAVNLAREAGFDCVEIHAGHGYLISQFLSPYTNHRRDEYGGSLENRMRLMQRVIRRVLEAAGNDLGVIVKMNMHDGFRRGMQEAECLEVARELERLGVHAIVLSAGFVSKAPMEVMRGAIRKALERAQKEAAALKKKDDRVIVQVEMLNESISKLTDELGKKPTIDEIANDLRIPQDKVLDILKLTGEDIDAEDRAANAVPEDEKDTDSGSH